jgi:MFS superfamily sulfate permease-like transporter
VLGWVEELGRYADVSIHTDARLTPGVVVYRPDDRIFFANAQYVKGRVLEAVHGAPWPVRWLVLDAEAVTNIDSSGLEALDELVSDLRELQVGIAVARLKDAARRQLDDAGISDAIGADHFYGSVHAAVAACTT